MTKTMEEVFQDAFENFKRHLIENFGARITNEDQLREIFLGEIESLVDAALDGDAESGNGIDELYSEAILECVQDDGEDDEE
jgi:hypothetical protein